MDEVYDLLDRGLQTDLVGLVADFVFRNEVYLLEVFYAVLHLLNLTYRLIIEQLSFF